MSGIFSAIIHRERGEKWERSGSEVGAKFSLKAKVDFHSELWRIQELLCRRSFKRIVMSLYGVFMSLGESL